MIVVNSGILNLSLFSKQRYNSSWCAVSVANGATLRIGGTGTFPANFASRSLALTSTIEYNGLAQTVSAETYGNLTLSSSSGAVVKTMPSTAFTVAGNFYCTPGAGTNVSATAAANIVITGSTTLMPALRSMGEVSHWI
ncbi:hypothetical protein FEF09_27515 [Chitinophaga pinensis]|uniref:Uncharacterized protein n=1 Tax=Chitinophaga pinensis TaxID=79329 RepID=A0A5C6LM81_9BACT|nr:hypothetical protein FEF09_27515 [Chitinophaga pinensis]